MSQTKYLIIDKNFCQSRNSDKGTFEFVIKDTGFLSNNKQLKYITLRNVTFTDYEEDFFPYFYIDISSLPANYFCDTNNHYHNFIVFPVTSNKISECNMKVPASSSSWRNFTISLKDKYHNPISYYHDFSLLLEFHYE